MTVRASRPTPGWTPRRDTTAALPEVVCRCTRVGMASANVKKTYTTNLRASLGLAAIRLVSRAFRRLAPRSAPMFDLPEFIRPRAAELHVLQNQIDDLNAAKSAIFKAAKKDSSKLIADGLKAAFGIVRMDASREKMAIDDKARTILAIMIGDTLVADNDAGEVVNDTCQKTGDGFDWRAARDAERATDFPLRLSDQTGT